MLVLTRRLGEGVQCGEGYRVVIAALRRGAVQLHITALNDAARAGLPVLDGKGRTWCHEGECVSLGGNITVWPVEIRRKGTRFGLDAPMAVKFDRVPGRLDVATKEMTI